LSGTKKSSKTAPSVIDLRREIEDLGELLGRILEVAKTQADAERGTLFLVDEKTEEIWSLIAHGLEKREIRLPLGRGIAGYVAKSGETPNIPNAYADPRFNRDADAQTGYRTRGIPSLPIRNKSGKIIAALQLLNKRRGGFTPADCILPSVLPQSLAPSRFFR
jgi:adenylate cyclase